MAVNEAVKVVIEPAQGYTGLPLPFCNDDMNMSAPVKQVGKIRKTMGVVPNTIWKSSSRIIPHKTDVGQSGPPIKIATLGIDRPFSPRTILIDFINVELTLTNCLTLTL